MMQEVFFLFMVKCVAVEIVATFELTATISIRNNNVDLFLWTPRKETPGDKYSLYSL